MAAMPFWGKRSKTLFSCFPPLVASSHYCGVKKTDVNPSCGQDIYPKYISHDIRITILHVNIFIYKHVDICYQECGSVVWRGVWCYNGKLVLPHNRSVFLIFRDSGGKPGGKNNFTFYPKALSTCEFRTDDFFEATNAEANQTP
jgi:hypothetical protein